MLKTEQQAVTPRLTSVTRRLKSCDLHKGALIPPTGGDGPHPGNARALEARVKGDLLVASQWANRGKAHAGLAHSSRRHSIARARPFALPPPSARSSPNFLEREIALIPQSDRTPVILRQAIDRAAQRLRVLTRGHLRTRRRR